MLKSQEHEMMENTKNNNKIQLLFFLLFFQKQKLYGFYYIVHTYSKIVNNTFVYLFTFY